MHLKSLTLRGFKSFASATTLRFEPGITCVVGPNGSGKSNVVDAISWVLGEQGAKALRGGKMEDVIFAGTAGRAALGRAEVTLTIDNSDGALPIEYTEVSITRRMFRSGESEYEINGDNCRLLDIQELLSDSGIGREMHVIVGQGQLDSVLQARPEDRRGFIEEAAGVLKHRKRKEKALRKLDAMQANLTRLTDLTGELRRQLKPLGKQAEVARRAASVQADLRDARLRLLADDFVELRDALHKEVADEAAMRQRRAEVEQALAQAQGRETGLSEDLAADAPLLARAQETWYRLSALQERFRGTAQLAAERFRHLTADTESSRSSRDPDELEAEAEEIKEQEFGLQEALDRDQARLTAAVNERQQLEQQHAEAEKAHVAAVRALADRREGMARLTGQVNGLRSRVSAREQEVARLTLALDEALGRAAEAQTELATLQTEVDALDQGELGLDARHEAAKAALAEATTRVAELTQAEREAEQQRASWQARLEALSLGLTRRDGAGALLAAAQQIPGMLGSVAALLTVQPGHESAVSAALGGIADAVAVGSPDAVVDCLRLLKTDDAGRAGFLVGGELSPASTKDWPVLPAGARWALDVVQAPNQLQHALGKALDQVALVADLEAAHQLVRQHPQVRAVTPDGDLLSGDWAVGGSAKAPSVIEVQAAVDEARQKLDEANSLCTELAAELTQAQSVRENCEVEVTEVLAAVRESDATMAAFSERLAALGAAARSATAEADRLARSRTEAEHAHDRDVDELSTVEESLQVAEATPLDEEPSTVQRDEYATAVTAARQTEVEVRLAVRTGEERARALRGRAESLLRAAAQERAHRAHQEELRQSRARGAEVASGVQRAAHETLQHLENSLRTAAAERDETARVRAVREGELLEIRAGIKELSGELERLTNAVHRDEVARAEQRLRIEALENKAAEEYGIELDTLLAEYGPDVAVPPTAQEIAEYEAAKERGEQVVAPQPSPYDRPFHEKRAARAERDLALLGKVNPLALEEFAALEERHAFLSTQLEDLKATRRDLLMVVKEVDERIHDVFATAFADTAREFEIVFRTLFPGGEGRLVLTDPNDMLATGIEVEARPPGKKIKRLSLLSGGERSLTAVALLVAIFRARPSPFYVMDEVEAALDDTNLGRLIGLIEELRSSSQLIIITHQKRTMEIADALYGVTMRGDGITTVISQRLRESDDEAEPAANAVAASVVAGTGEAVADVVEPAAVGAGEVAQESAESA